jgi:hypothetical protein
MRKETLPWSLHPDKVQLLLAEQWALLLLDLQEQLAAP